MSHAATFKPREDYKKHNDKTHAKFARERFYCDLCKTDVGYFAKSTHLRTRRHLENMDRVESATTFKADSKPSAAYELAKSRFASGFDEQSLDQVAA